MNRFLIDRDQSIFLPGDGKLHAARHFTALAEKKGDWYGIIIPGIDKREFMESYETPESTESSSNPLKGLGQKLKLHIIIPITYAVVLIAMFIIRHV